MATSTAASVARKPTKKAPLTIRRPPVRTRPPATPQQFERAGALIAKQLTEAAAAKPATNGKPERTADTIAIPLNLYDIYQILASRAKVGDEVAPVPGIAISKIRALQSYGILEITRTSLHAHGERVAMFKMLTHDVVVDGTRVRKGFTRSRRLLPSTRAATALANRATPEEMRRLLERIEKQEYELNDSLSLANDKKIAELQSRVGTARGDDLTRAFREMRVEMDAREALAAGVRAEAFQAVEASGMPEARFLGLLKPEYPKDE